MYFVVQIDFKLSLGKCNGKLLITVYNTLEHQSEIGAPNSAWGTNLTYIKIHEGFSYLVLMINLFSYCIDRCSM